MLIKIFFTVLKDGLFAFFSILHMVIPITVLGMFLWLYQRDKGRKQAWLDWWMNFRSDHDFQKMMAFVFYTCVVLSITLFRRTYWEKWPLKKISGHWGLFLPDGSLYLENIENLLLFLPLLFLFWLCYDTEINRKLKDALRNKSILKRSAQISAFFSLIIELSQWIFHKGTLQLSDLFFNILGGVFGGLLYLVCIKKK